MNGTPPGKLTAGDRLSGVTIRDEVLQADPEAIRKITSSTLFFGPAEIDVAVELAQERLEKGLASGYHFLFAELDGRTVGYTCYGPIACTVGSFDLYWIAVHQDYRHAGLGRTLIKAAEERITAMAGRRIYVDTSSRPQYGPTRRFYESCGYQVEAVFKGFYTPTDDKVVYSKGVAS